MISPTAWLERLQQELAVARAGEEPEGVHQVRVAAGRLRAWLELAGHRALVDDLRWLRRSAAEVRDLDVLIAEHSDPECARWLAERRAASLASLGETLDGVRVDALLSALAWIPPVERRRAKTRIPRFVRRALRAGDDVEREPTDLRAWHVLRRALRRLRYAEEWLDADTKDLHEFLDVLGDLNNRVVEAHHLAECRSSHALEHAVAVEQKITDKRDEAALGWKTLRKKLEERE